MSKTEDLYQAIRNGNFEAVENFLSQPGINPNKRFENGSETMMSAAVRRGSVGIVDLLVNKGANVNVNLSDQTPLRMASYDGEIRLVKALIGHGAHIESTDRSGRTAIHWAARQGHFHVFKWLDEHKASLREVACDGNTLLHEAAVGGDPDIIQHIIDKSADVHARNNNGDCPIHIASSSGHTQAMHQLLKHGACIGDTNNNGENILHIVARAGHLRVFKFLVEQIGVDSDFINQATKDSCFTTIKDKQCVTKYWTALHFACAFGYVDIVKYLLIHGADKTMRTKDQLNATEVCEAYRQRRILPLLKLNTSVPLSASKRSYMSHNVHARTKHS